jgi:hypothetical protein
LGRDVFTIILRALKVKEHQVLGVFNEVFHSHFVIEQIVSFIGCSCHSLSQEYHKDQEEHLQTREDRGLNDLAAFQCPLVLRVVIQFCFAELCLVFSSNNFQGSQHHAYDR